MIKKTIFILFTTLLFTSCDPATLGGILASVPKATPALTNEEVINGLKEALKVGATNAVNFTAKPDGFYKNAFIKIPFPAEAEKVKQFAINHGMQTQVDKFEMNLNRAAEQAAKEAVSVFVNAITSMSIQDGYTILKGDSTAATAYLKKATTTELTQKFSPIVQKAIDAVELTSYYEPLATAYNTSTLLTGAEKVNTDLKGYVTQKALDGLFFYVAHEEKNIRRDPKARVSDILKKVFGSLDGKS